MNIEDVIDSGVKKGLTATFNFWKRFKIEGEERYLKGEISFEELSEIWDKIQKEEFNKVRRK